MGRLKDCWAAGLVLGLMLGLVLGLTAAGCSDSRTGTSPTTDGPPPVGFGDGGVADGAAGDIAVPDGTDGIGGGGDVPADVLTDGPEDPCAGCVAPAVCLDGHCVAAQACTPGETTVCLGPQDLLTCHESGEGFVPVPCGSSYQCLMDGGVGACVPQICVPGDWICQDLTHKKQCNEDGSGFLEAVACEDGAYCQSGKCGSSCEIDPKFGNFVGCAFWTVDLDNYPDPFTGATTPEDTPHAVVVSNPGELDATLTFEPPPGVTYAPADPVVPGNSSRVFELPVMNTDGTGVHQTAIRLTSSRPVLVHQFNPWSNDFSNDASLLLPEPFAGTDYVVLSWPTSPIGLIFGENQNGYFTVLALSDNTSVTFTTPAGVEGSGPVMSMEPGDTQTVVIDRGEVLNVQADPAHLFAPLDISGATISADKPVMAWAGHEEAVIGDSIYEEGDSACCADHLEEQLLHTGLLGSEYLAVKAKPRGSEPDLWRVQAAEPGVTLSTTPAIAGLNGVTLANVGDWVEAQTTQSFELSATGKVQVAQYLLSQEATEDFIGDPSLILAVPTERLRSSYVLAVPPEFPKNYVTVVKPAGVAVATGSGVLPEADFSPVGSGAWVYTYVELPVGVHKFQGDAPFGLVAYGFANASSYGYLGGLSLDN